MSSVKYRQILRCKYVHILSANLLTKNGYNGIIYIETRKKHKTRKGGSKNDTKRNERDYKK